MKKLLCLLICTIVLMAFCVMSASAETLTGECGDNATWSLDTETGVLTISGEGEITANIWSSYNVKTVIIEDGITGIAPGAFSGCTSIESITIPDSVTIIRGNAFEGCTSLESITLPNNITSIGTWHFADCTSLTSIIIPESVTSISNWAFSGCTSLTSVTIPKSVTSIHYSCFSGCENLTIRCYKGSYAETFATNNSIPVEYIEENTETLSGACGDNATWLLNTETGVLTISGSGAMWDYYGDQPVWSDEYDWENPRNVKTAIIEEGITYIGAWAFSNCYSLETVYIPASVEDIGEGAMSWSPIEDFVVDTDNKSFVEIDGVLFTYDMKTLVAYSNIKEEESYSVPNGVETINFAAIINQYLAELIIPDSVTQIYGRNSFISSFVVSENNPVYSSVDGVLFDKYKTTLIAYPSYKRDTDYTVPNGTTSIADGAFVDAHYIKTLTFPESVTEVFTEAIWGCWNLKSVTFESLSALYLESSIGWCENLKEVTVYAQNVNLRYSDWLFNGCPDTLVVRCVKGSGVDTFATERGYTVEYVGKTIPEIKLIIGSSTAYVDGSEVTLQMPVIFKNDTLVAPARFLAAEFGDGTPMTWDAENLVLTFKNGGTTFELKANETIAKVNGEYVELDEPFYTIEENYPSIIDAYYLPIFFFTDTFGLEILWDLDEKSFTVNPKEIDDGEGEGEEEQPYTPEIIITVGSTTAYVDGEEFTLDIAPRIRDGEVLAAVRFVAEVIAGATVSWNDETKTATLQAYGKTVELTIYSTTAKVNGEEVVIPSAPIVDNSRTYLPVRFVAEVFGKTVAWDADTQTMTINPHEILTGECGDNATWSLDTVTGVLTISGTGAMWDYPDDNAPWWGDDRVKSLVVEEGITYIGQWAFHCIMATEFSLPSTLREIGSCGFAVLECETFVIPEGVTTLGGWALGGSTRLKSVVIPKSVVNFGESLFVANQGGDIFVTIHCYRGSAADEYAKANGIAVEYIVEDDVEGDFDGDGVVAVSDAIFVLDAILGGNATEDTDINGDGKVNLLDILSIIAKLVK